MLNGVMELWGIVQLHVLLFLEVRRLNFSTSDKHFEVFAQDDDRGVLTPSLT